MAGIRKTSVGHFQVTWGIYLESLDGKKRRKQRCRTFKRLKDAKIFAASVEAREGGQTFNDRPMLTLSQFVPKFIDARQNSIRRPVKDPTTDGYAHKLAYLERHLGNTRLDKITSDLLEAAFQVIAKNEPRKPLAAGTLYHIRSTANNLFAEAIKQKYITANPVTGTEPIPTQVKHHGMPTLKDVERLLASALPPWARAFVMTALHTGARRGEILGLAWNHIDLATGQLSIDQVVEHSKAHGVRIRPGAKTASSSRQVVMSEPLTQALKDWQAHQRKEALRGGLSWSSGALLFPRPGTYTEPWCPRNLTRAVRKVMDAAGIDRSVSPVHGWRHRLATSLMTLAPTAVVSTILGHASPTITRRLYQHAEGTHLEEAARKTAEVFDFSKAAKAK